MASWNFLNRTISSPASRTAPRRRLSCSTVIFVLFLGFVALFLYSMRSFGGRFYNSLTPAEQAAYKQWVDTPLPVTADQLKPPPVPDAALTAEKTALFEEFIAADYSMTTLTESSDPCSGRWHKWDNLTDAQAAQLAERFRPVVARAGRLVSDPRYSFNSRLSPLASEPPQKYGNFPIDSIGSVCTGYANALAQQEDWNGAIDAVETMLELLRCDRFVSSNCRISVTAVAAQAAGAARETAESSFNPEFTSRTLALLTFHRPNLFEENINIIQMGEPLALVSRMKDDGYISDHDLTPRSLITTRGHEVNEYLHWLINHHLAEGDPRLEAARQYARHYPADSFAEKLFGNFITLGFGVVLYGVEPHHMVFEWKLRESKCQFAMYHLTDYDRMRLVLAQRIAHLNNEPIPVAPEDFVPRYLPEYPIDQETGDALRVENAK